MRPGSALYRETQHRAGHIPCLGATLLLRLLLLWLLLLLLLLLLLRLLLRPLLRGDRYKWEATTGPTAATGRRLRGHRDSARRRAARSSEEQHCRSDSERTTGTWGTGSSAVPPSKRDGDEATDSRGDEWGRQAPGGEETVGPRTWLADRRRAERSRELRAET